MLSRSRRCLQEVRDCMDFLDLLLRCPGLSGSFSGFYGRSGSVAPKMEPNMAPKEKWNQRPTRRAVCPGSEILSHTHWICPFLFFLLGGMPGGFKGTRGSQPFGGVQHEFKAHLFLSGTCGTHAFFSPPFFLPLTNLLVPVERAGIF